MGFNFQAGHPADVYQEPHGSKIAALILKELGPVPLGQPGEVFCLPDELGWSWWAQLQELAHERLGDAGSSSIRSVAAWQGVYLDGIKAPTVLWPNGRKNTPAQPAAKALQATPPAGSSWFSRLLARLGIGPKHGDVPQEAHQAMQQMIEELASPAEVRDGLQVGSLRPLIAELEKLFKLHAIKPTPESVEAKMRFYSDSDDRIDDDPAIQCLCHAWLTAKNALTRGVPLWLLK